MMFKQLTLFINQMFSMKDGEVFTAANAGQDALS